jgi:hypothetical protein
MSLFAYFDESGDPADPNVTAFAIGGCIAPMEEWSVFEHKWNSALADEGIRWFHMVDFEHPERRRRNQFFQWDPAADCPVPNPKAQGKECLFLQPQLVVSSPRYLRVPFPALEN